MLNNKEILKVKVSANKFGQFIRRNGFSILMGIFIIVILVNPDAKSWVLRQLMATGGYNARIEGEGYDVTNQAFSDFDFEDGKGTVQLTASLRGKVVFINFWASWCPPCRAEFPSIEILYSRFKNNPDVSFLTVNEDNELSAANAYMKGENFTVPFYKTRGNVPDAIYTGTLPTTIVLDKNGKIRFRHEGLANYGSEKFMKQIEDLIKE
ncbi:TlpA disulfide reductase family protein [[Flexibacter] sp. ATCC 35208]|uniref:TlpA family protein disulfide reductase n=1 Tax=[Flexibacter] sp. ATCC 35208 TaxID=1936242 RepID=UPI0009C6BFB3|nr:TlpA disulfide reductase family protein [[Flexibacter] sp. ATCC 35208]OMP79348.1 thioredoxin [[Flexibacter] sp. ATCC 35208]